MAAEFRQHICAVAVGVGEVDVACERLVEAFERVFGLPHPVQGLTDKVIGTRLSGPERQRSARKVDALLKLTLSTGDDGNVVQRVGVLRVVAQHLGIAIHGERNLPRTMVHDALLHELCSGLMIARAGLVNSLWGRCQVSPSLSNDDMGLSWYASGGRDSDPATGRGESGMKDILDRLEKRRGEGRTGGCQTCLSTAQEHA